MKTMGVGVHVGQSLIERNETENVIKQFSLSGTTSNVSFIVTGDLGESEPRVLEDGERSVLKRANIDSFLMAVPRSLGSLTYLRYMYTVYTSRKTKF